MKKLYSVAVIFIFMGIAAVITAYIFNTRFAKVTIDAWSFFAASFLIIEALYKIYVSKESFWPNQFFRVLRIIIGVCIFTIHTCQVIYGI